MGNEEHGIHNNCEDCADLPGMFSVVEGHNLIDPNPLQFVVFPHLLEVSRILKEISNLAPIISHHKSGGDIFEEAHYKLLGSLAFGVFASDIAVLLHEESDCLVVLLVKGFEERGLALGVLLVQEAVYYAHVVQ